MQVINQSSVRDVDNDERIREDEQIDMTNQRERKEDIDRGD